MILTDEKINDLRFRHRFFFSRMNLANFGFIKLPEMFVLIKTMNKTKQIKKREIVNTV